MSTSDIVKYVQNTPGNTNPNVIKSMVEVEKRQFQEPVLKEVLEQAKAYTDESKIGSIREIKVPWFIDENTKPTHYYLDTPLIKISDLVPYPEDLYSFRMLIPLAFKIEWLTSSIFYINFDMPGFPTLLIVYDSSFMQLTQGIYSTLVKSMYLETYLYWTEIKKINYQLLPKGYCGTLQEIVSLVLPKQQINFKYNEEFGLFAGGAVLSILEAPGVLSIKDKIRVTWNQQVYINKSVEEEGEVNSWVFGNIGLMTKNQEEDTGEPFILGIGINGQDVIIEVFSQEPTATIKIESYEEEICKIDKKFLPEGVGYIDTLPFYIIPETTSSFDKNTISIHSEPIKTEIENFPDIKVGDKLTVGWNGTTSIQEVQQYNNILFIGNPMILYDGNDNLLQYIFYFEKIDGKYYQVVQAFSPGTYKYFLIDQTKKEEIIHPIDQKFIPTLDYLILNGADGKKYSVSINQDGQLISTLIQ